MVATASPERIEHSKKCGESVKVHCKKWSQAYGDINTPKGRKGCKANQIKAGVWGEDKSPMCQQDPEDARNCKHTACAYSEYLTPGDYAGVIDTHINSLESEAKPEQTSFAKRMMARSKFFGGIKSKKRSRKMKKMKKSKKSMRKSRKSRKRKSGKKGKKTRKH